MPHSYGASLAGVGFLGPRILDARMESPANSVARMNITRSGRYWSTSEGEPSPSADPRPLLGLLRLHRHQLLVPRVDLVDEESEKQSGGDGEHAGVQPQAAQVPH